MRRRIIPGGAALVALLVVSFLVSPAHAARPQSYQLNPAHSGFLDDTSFVPPLQIKWSRTLGLQLSYPVIADGRVFITALPSESEYGTTLYALDAGDGSILWSHPVGESWWWSAVAFDAGRLFLHDSGGRVRAFDPATGEVLWDGGGPGRAHPPVADNGALYMGADGFNDRVVALSQSDGSVLWSTPVTGSSHSGPALDEEHLYFTWSASNFYSLRRDTGAIRWTTNNGSSGGGGYTPSLRDGRLYTRDLSNGERVFDAATGTVVGTFVSSRIPAFTRDHVLYTTGWGLGAHDPDSGVEEWHFSREELSIAPVTIGNYVYAGAHGGALFALDAQTGAVVWSKDLGRIDYPDESNVSEPIDGFGAGEGLLLVPAGGKLVALDAMGEPEPPVGEPTPPPETDPDEAPPGDPPADEPTSPPDADPDEPPPPDPDEPPAGETAPPEQDPPVATGPFPGFGFQPPSGQDAGAVFADTIPPSVQLRAAPRIRTRVLRRGGVAMRARCSEAGAAEARLGIDRRSARAIGLRRRDWARMGTATFQCDTGWQSVRVAVARRLRSKLVGIRRATLRVTVTARDAAGNRGRRTASVLLRR